MKAVLIVLCLAVASCTALPTHRTSVLDLLEDLENIVHEDTKILLGKMINVIHVVENGVVQVRDLVPVSYEKLHEEVEDVLAELKKVSEEVQELLGRQNVMFGFDLLSGLTELSGGTKLSTVLHLLSVADKAHRVMDDAKEFMPKLDSTLDRIQSKIQDHVKEFANQVIRDLGLQTVLKQRGVVKQIEELFDVVTDQGHTLILDLVHKMKLALDLLKLSLPDEHDKVQVAVKEIEKKIDELVAEIKKSLTMKSFSILDIAGDFTGGTDLGTAFKVMSLVEKFNRVMQDVRNFQPNAEKLLHHSVERVAVSFQEFIKHTAGRLIDV